MSYGTENREYADHIAYDLSILCKTRLVIKTVVSTEPKIGCVHQNFLFYKKYGAKLPILGFVLTT